MGGEAIRQFEDWTILDNEDLRMSFSLMIDDCLALLMRPDALLQCNTMYVYLYTMFRERQDRG
jgi:hypothetical protein